jgi:aminoglycoside N3'-acetyltransferase
MFYTKIFEIFPMTEITVKNIYSRSDTLHNTIRKLAATGLRKKFSFLKRDFVASNVTLEHLLSRIRACGVGQGDILIVHSSMNQLKATGNSTDEIIDGLKSIVGETGTLALPAFAIFEGEPVGVDRMNDSKYDEVLNYDIRSPSIWTGVLAKRLLGRPGAVRSRHPLNSLVALGPHASDMMSGAFASANRLVGRVLHGSIVIRIMQK